MPPKSTARSWKSCSTCRGVRLIDNLDSISVTGKLRLGTRGSRLALAQANRLQADLLDRYPGLDVEIVTIKTSGDRGERDRLGAFVREIQEALLGHRIDVALHCLKDLPTAPVQGLTLAAHLAREDARDTIITRGERFEDLASGAVVGTGSVRRTSQLAAQRSDIVFRPLVGNVDTRLRKLIEGDYDAIVLAIAGLKRLGLLDVWNESDYRGLTVHALTNDQMLPAPGQAVLVLETRSDDDKTIRLISPMNDAATESCSACERAFLQTFGGGCSVPVASFARLTDDGLELAGLVASPDGTQVIKGVAYGATKEGLSLGRQLAQQLGEQGGFSIVASVSILNRPGGSVATAP